MRSSFAICSDITCFCRIEASAAPPRTVKSSPPTTTGRPSMRPRPSTKFAGWNDSISPFAPYCARPASAPISWKLSGSSSAAIRSRTVSRPASCWRLTLSGPPIWRASASRRRNSSMSLSQPISRPALDPRRDYSIRDARRTRAGDMPEIKVPSELNAIVWKIEAAAGQTVSEGDTLIVLEAMKMEIPVAAPRAGTVKTVLVAEKQQVAEGQPLVHFTILTRPPELAGRPPGRATIGPEIRRFHSQRLP